MTNYEKIKGMTVNEMAELLCYEGSWNCCKCKEWNDDRPEPCSFQCQLRCEEWLESEVEHE